MELYPNKQAFDMDNIDYELETNTQVFLHSMFYISVELEKLNQI